MSKGNKEPQNLPYKSLGDRLKNLREKRRESLAEVSGAVEIEVEVLSAIEIGSERPSEDILLLLISHFATKEDLATKLWELAGYNQDQLPARNMVNGEDGAYASVMVMPADARIVYTDMVHVMVNNYGVVMNFMQGAGPQNQPLAVARIGMSKEHAQSVLEILQKTLELDTPKALPSPKQTRRSRKTDK
jgi:transcriptional regulator with XRE-family HTH domain